ncbi:MULTISPECIES: amidase family protein [Bacillus cereus group]|uniref:amidase family protein n=1 Tax=Bacillus cereus group TaxID=86661 RepID=UPI000D9A9AA5|nr:amidase family protein [Bacillus cereus]MCU4946845.1 amidase family protein [Bacillus cereus]SPT76295.1 amidase [Bacillus cereus]
MKKPLKLITCLSLSLFLSNILILNTHAQQDVDKGVNVKSKLPKPIIYDKERVLKPIELQLQTVDINKIKLKENLVINASVDDIQNFIEKKMLTYEELVSIYLMRIEQYDQNGPEINSITEINPDAIKEARELDTQMLASKNSPLYGIPILIKDNIQTKNIMPTSAGTFVLRDWIADKDATIVSKLKNKRAIILGKTNMSELATTVSNTMPHGYSGKKGQTLNPYGPNQFATSGSSSGSAAAVTSDFSTLAIGTDTQGSILGPSENQSIVGLRPTTGLVSRSGIIPLSSEYDTAGSMARSVKDAAILLNAMIGYDLQDEKTKQGKSYENTDYTKGLSKQGLKNKKIGFLFNANEVDPSEKAIVEKLTRDLNSAGAIVTDNLKTESRSMESVLYDFPNSFNTYLARQKNIPIKNLSGYIKYNEKDPERRIMYGQDLMKNRIEMFNEFISKISKEELKKEQVKEQNFGKQQLNQYLVNQDFDALILFKSNDIINIATGGFPAIAVPAGYDSDGRPIGLTFIGKHFAEKELFNMTYAYEQQSKNRKSPHFGK